MLRIKMDRKDVPISLEELKAAGYEVDRRGRQGFDFIYLIHREASPKNIDEAYAFLQKTFFFPPYDVWIDGKKVQG
jgi:hypothetical protein